MKKDLLFSYRTWLIFSLLLFVGVAFTFSTVMAANSSLENKEVDLWSSSGNKEVTVKNPSDVEIYVAAPQEECVLDTTGIVSHWPLDEQVGATTFVDVAGSINGTCDEQNETCPTKTIGKIGGAFTFENSDQDVISIPADVNPGKAIIDTMANGDFTAGVWVKTTQTCAVSDKQKNKVFFGRYRNVNTNGTWWLGCTEPGGVAVFRLRDSSNNARQINGSSNITDGQWHYIVGVRDAGADKNHLYVDGILEGTLDLPAYNSNSVKFSSDMPITMGAYDEPTNYYLDGTLDEVVLYDRVVPANEIGSYYDACEAASAFTYIPIVRR